MESQPPGYEASIDIVGNQLTRVEVTLPNGTRTFTTNTKASGNPLSFSGHVYCKSPEEDLSGKKSYQGGPGSNGKFLFISIGMADPHSAAVDFRKPT